MIDGVYVKQLKKHVDERGFVIEMLRCDDPIFENFGQCYVSTCKPGFVKGWHYHRKQRDNFSVVSGKGRLVLYDDRKDSKTKGKINEFDMGDDNLILVSIPKGVFHGFECIGKEPVFFVNTPSEPYNHEEPDEFRVDPFKNDIPYKWTAKRGK